MYGQAEELKDLKRKTDPLEGRVAILENLVQVYGRKTDDVEQYGRRLCLRIDNILIREGENPKVIEQELQKEFAEMGVELPEDAIDRAHRIAQKYDVKGELQRENKLISYERAFKMLENDIAGIGQAVLELLSFKVESGNHQRGISLLQKFSDIFGNMRLVLLKMTSHLTSHNFQILKVEIFSKLCKI